MLIAAKVGRKISKTFRKDGVNCSFVKNGSGRVSQ